MIKNVTYFLFLGFFCLMNQQATAQFTISSSSTTNVTRTPASGATAGLVTYTATAPASAAILNVSGIVADLVNGYNVTVDYSSTTQNITLSNSITISGNMANDATLTLKAASSLIIAASVNIDATQNANTKKLHLLFWTDDDASGRGQIIISTSTTTTTGLIKTNGGNITMSGGLDVTTGFAACDSLGIPTKPYAGVDVYNTQIDANGGDILVRGAISNVLLSHSYRATYFESTISGTNCLVKTSGSGTINIYGDCSKSRVGSGPNNWGINTANADFVTASGNINFYGWGGNLANSNTRGEVLGGGNILSDSGDINIIDSTAGTSAAAYNGIVINNCKIGKGTLASASGDITINGDKISLGAPNEFNTTGNILFQANHGNSFLAAFVVPATNNFFNAAKIDFGLPGNTSDDSLVTDANAIPLSGPLNMYGTKLKINRALNGPGQTIKLSAITSAAQSATAVITADYLSLTGTGSFTMPALNLVDTLAAGSSITPITNLAFHNSIELNIATVPALDTGINATGTITIATQSGNLNVLKNIVTTNSSLPAVSLYADSSKLAGNGVGGQVTVASGVLVSANIAGQVRLYTGNQPASTGLSSLVSSGNGRMLIDRTTTIFTPVLSAGVYALFRSGATLPVQLIYFNGKKQNATVTLNWATANGRLDKYFEIESSVDGKSWSVIGTVNGESITTETNYSYSSVSSSTASFYRLKLISTDGAIQYSNTIQIDPSVAIDIISIYPVPTKNHLIHINTQLDNFEYSLYDNAGKQLISGQSQHANEQVSLKDINAGVYFLILSKDNKYIGTYKVMIQ